MTAQCARKHAIILFNRQIRLCTFYTVKIITPLYLPKKV